MKIRPRKNPSGKTVFQLDLGEGPGMRKTFPSRAKAQTALDQEKDRRAAHGRMADDITPAEMAEIVTARHRMIEAGGTISQAVEFYLTHATRLQEQITVPELIQRFIDDREARKKSVRYIQQLRVSLGSLEKLHPLTKAHDLTQAHLEAWLRVNERWGAKTRNNYLGDISAMFGWALGKTRGFARINPALDVEREEWKKGRTVCLDVPQAEELLRKAAEGRHWRVLSHVVLGMLGGIRPAEIERLQWSSIDLHERTVVVLATDAKTAARRVVDLTPQAAEWLALIPEKNRQGPVIVRAGWVDEWTIFRRDLGWDVGREAKNLPKCAVKIVHGRWPHDALRHTFASMHYAHHQNEAALQVQMGHRSAKMLHQHYRAVRTRKEAAEFWALSPSEELLEMLRGGEVAE